MHRAYDQYGYEHERAEALQRWLTSWRGSKTHIRSSPVTRSGVGRSTGGMLSRRFPWPLQGRGGRPPPATLIDVEGSFSIPQLSAHGNRHHNHGHDQQQNHHLAISLFTKISMEFSAGSSQSRVLTFKFLMFDGSPKQKRSQAAASGPLTAVKLQGMIHLPPPGGAHAQLRNSRRHAVVDRPRLRRAHGP